MATQEERIQQLIATLQGPAPGLRRSFDAPPEGLRRSLLPRQLNVPDTQQGSFLDIASGAPMQPAPFVQQPVQPPQPMPEPTTGLDLFKAFDSPFATEPPPSTTGMFEGTDDSLYAVPRGIARGAMQTGLSMAEGMFSIVDMLADIPDAVGLAATKDLVDRETSEFFQNIQEAKRYVGNEEGMIGKLFEGVGSIFTFALPGLGQAGALARGTALAAKGPQYLEASRRALGLAKGLSGIKYTFAGSAGAGQSSAMLEAYKAAGNDYTVGQRNLATALGIPIGLLELLAPEMVLRGIPNSIAGATKSQILRRLGEAGTTGIGEGAQEAFSGVLQEVAAKLNYNPDMPIGESMLSDFGYGAGAGGIFDLLTRGKVRYPKSDKEITKEYQDSTPLAPLDDEFIQDAQRNETAIAVYDADGNQLSGQIIGTDGDDAKVLIDEELFYVPLNQTPSEDQGLSFAKDADLITPRYQIDGRDVGSLTAQELEEAKLRAFLPPELVADVDAGNLSVLEAVKAMNIGEDGTAQVSAKKAYDVKAIEAELDRRNPSRESNRPTANNDKQLTDEEAGIIDSGENADEASDPIISGILGDDTDTVIGRVAGDKDVERYDDIEDKAIKAAFKRGRVPKKAQAGLIDEVAGTEGASLADLDNAQKAQLMDKAFGYQDAQKAKAEAAEQQRVADEAARQAEADEIKQALGPTTEAVDGSAPAFEEPLDEDQDEELVVSTEKQDRRAASFRKRLADAETPIDRINAAVSMITRGQVDNNPQLIAEGEAALRAAEAEGFTVQEGTRKGDTRTYSEDDEGLIRDITFENAPNEGDIETIERVQKVGILQDGELVQVPQITTSYKAPDQAPEAQTTQDPFQSKAVEDSKPRYRNVMPVFESQLDKALYIVGNPRSKSKADDQIMGELRKYLGRGAPGFPDSEIRSLGMLVRQKVKELGEPAQQGDQTDFDVPQIAEPNVSANELQRRLEGVPVPTPEVDATPEVVVEAEPEVVVEAEPEAKPAKRLQTKKQKALSAKEKKDIVNFANGLLLEKDSASAPLRKLVSDAYGEQRAQGKDHNGALDALETNEDLIEAANQEDELSDLDDIDFLRKEGLQDTGVIQGTQVTATPDGPGIVKSKAPLDINDFNRVKAIVNSIAPEANLVVASQLYGPSRGGEANQNEVEIDGVVYPMEEALGLQAGNIVAVSLADGFLDPQNRAYHEATHFLYNNNYLTDKDKADLAANIDRLQGIVSNHLGATEYNRAFDGLTPEQKLNELIAYGSALYNRGLDIDGKVPKEFNPGLRRIFSKIAKLFKQIKAAFSGEGRPAEIEQVFEEIRQGRVGKRLPQATSQFDATGLSASTPLYMIKQGPAAAVTEARPQIKSRLVGTLQGKASQKALPEAWATIKKNDKGKDQLSGILQGTKIEEFNDSKLASFLATLPQDKAVSGQELLDHVSDMEQIVEIQIYGRPIDRSAYGRSEDRGPGIDSETAYRAALQEDRNNQAFNQVANQAMTSLRLNKFAMNVIEPLKMYLSTNDSVPNPSVDGPALPQSIQSALNEISVFTEPTDNQRKGLIKALTLEIKDPKSGFDKKLLGQILVENSYKGQQLKATEEEAESINLDPTLTKAGVGSEVSVDPTESEAPNFYYAYTTMGGREIPQPPEGQLPAALEDRNYRDIVLSVPTLAGEGWYHGHFPDIRNPIMHMRVSDIVLDNGDIALVVEEIQSDLHQSAQTQMKALAASDLYSDGQISSDNFDRLNREEKQLVRQAVDEYKDKVYGVTVPDLPLKNENQRLAFAMDMLTKMAVKNGYDQIAISNSEMQVERYRNGVKEHIDGLVLSALPKKVMRPKTRNSDGSVLFEVVRDELGGAKDLGFTDKEIDEMEEDGIILFKEDVLARLNENIGLLTPVELDIDQDLSFPKAQALGGMPLGQEAFLEQEEKVQYADQAISQAFERVEDLFNPQVKGDFMLRFFNLDLEAAERAIKSEFDESSEALYEDVVALSMAQALIERNPLIPKKILASYTQPVEGVSNEGEYFSGSFYRGTIELGEKDSRLSFDNALKLNVNDWLGENISKLVLDEMGTSSGFYAPNLVSFVQEKITQLEQLKAKKERGEQLTAQELESESLLDVPAIRDARDRTTGAIDLPVGGGFENIYDQKMPQQLVEAMARLFGTSGKPFKKAKEEIKRANKDKRLYIGTGDSPLTGMGDVIPFEEATIVDISNDPAASAGSRSRPIGEGTAEAQALQRALIESDTTQDFFRERDPDFPAEDFGDVTQRYAITTSPQRNQLRTFEITDDMRSSDQLQEASEIYYARKENDRVEATNKGTDDLRGVFKNARQRGIDFINSLPFFNTLRAMPDKREFYLSRAEYLGVVARSSKIAEYLRDEIGNKFLTRKGSKNRQSTELLRSTIYQYMTTGEPAQEEALFKQLQALDNRAAAAAFKAKDMIERLGGELMNAGLLPAKTYFENKRSYLPRMYLKHVLEDKRDAKFSYLKQRKDLDPEAQEALGAINELDPAFLVSRAIQRPVRDLQFIEWMNSISENKNWTTNDDQFLVPYGPPDENGQPSNVSGFYLINEVQTLRDIATALEAAEPERAARLRNDADQMEQAVITTFEERGLSEYLTDPNKDISVALQQYGDQYRRVPKTREYGLLAGRLVRTEIYDDVVSSGAMLNVGDEAYVNLMSKGRKFTAVWKTIKVPLNPPTIARNTFSNAILIHLSGVPFHRVLPRMIEAAREIVAYRNNDFENSKHFAEMLKRGVQQSSFTDQELMQMSDDMLDFLKSVDAKDIGLLGWLKLNTWTRLANKASNIYQGIEVVGKTAIAIDVMERQGGSADDAFLKAQEYLFDYSDVPQVVRGLRQSPLGIPFLTFQYKVLPVLAKTALRNPTKFAPYVALSYALPSLFMSMFDIDDDEYEQVKKSLPDYLRNNPGLIPLPARDAQGRLQFMDTSYLYPWGSLSGLGANLAAGVKTATGTKAAEDQGFSVKDVTSLVGMFGGPAWSLFGASQNLDPFTQRPIVNPSDPMYIENAIERPFYKRGKLTDAMFWAANQYVLPGFLNTEYGAVSKLNTALRGGKKASGVESDTVGQALMRMIGLNVTNVDPRQILLSLTYLDKERNDVLAARRRVLKDQTLSRAERQRRVKNYNSKLEDYRQKYAALVEAGRTTRLITERLRREDREAE